MCVDGDDRERDYDVVWAGAADVDLCRSSIAILRRSGSEREHLVYLGEYGWGSVGTESIRDCTPARGYPDLTDARLAGAL